MRRASKARVIAYSPATKEKTWGSISRSRSGAPATEGCSARETIFCSMSLWLSLSTAERQQVHCHEDNG
jgi:hypothetical protein